MNMEKMPGAESEDTAVARELETTLGTIAKEDSMDISPADIKYVAQMLVKTFAEQNDPLELSEIRDMNAETRRTFKKYLAGRGNVSAELAAADKVAVVNGKDEVVGLAPSDEGAHKIIGDSHAAL